MAREERVSMTYDTILINGLREARADGTLISDEPDEPYIIRLRRVTVTEVHDGRGKNWSASTKRYEDIADLTVAEAGALASAIVSDIAYCAREGERRVLTAEPIKEG